MFWDLSSPAAAAKLLQSCPTLWDPIDGSPLGSYVPGILQARTLEWVAIPFSNYIYVYIYVYLSPGDLPMSVDSDLVPLSQLLVSQSGLHGTWLSIC